MTNYGDKVTLKENGKSGTVIGFMRYRGVSLVKGEDFERWVADGNLEKEETCSDTETESET